MNEHAGYGKIRFSSACRSGSLIAILLVYPTAPLLAFLALLTSSKTKAVVRATVSRRGEAAVGGTNGPTVVNPTVATQHPVTALYRPVGSTT
ncbi:MAG: hypothetical protein OEM02_06545 [Desulfobulbaceae bacterium]|nr:hypothetical protein [Desulfobulbaceae bacterium]